MGLIVHAAPMLTPNAVTDLEEIERWNEALRVGLGIRFRESVETKFNEIQQAPQQFAIQTENVRIAVMEPFPCLILFEASPEQVTILAV